jgi:hypothetical protein
MIAGRQHLAGPLLLLPKGFNGSGMMPLNLTKKFITITVTRELRGPHAPAKGIPVINPLSSTSSSSSIRDPTRPDPARLN